MNTSDEQLGSALDRVSAGTRDAILAIVEPAYIRDVAATVKSRFAWRRTGDVCEATSKALSGLASILAFAAGAYDNKEISFAAGCVGTVSLTFMIFASYSSREAKERTEQLNTVLRHVGVENLPTIETEPQVQ